MEYSYSLAGLDNCMSVTGNANIFGGVLNLIEKFTAPFIFQDKEEEEASSSSQVLRKDMEIPPFIFGNYFTKKSINIRIEYLNNDEYIAAFEEAGISFSAGTATEAIQELKIELIEVYKSYKSEACLGSWPRHQLDVLEKYIDEEEI
jgi:hypothetical protein